MQIKRAFSEQNDVTLFYGSCVKLLRKSENQFSLARAILSTCGRAQNQCQFLISNSFLLVPLLWSKGTLLCR